MSLDQGEQLSHLLNKMGELSRPPSPISSNTTELTLPGSRFQKETATNKELEPRGTIYYEQFDSWDFDQGQQNTREMGKIIRGEDLPSELIEEYRKINPNFLKKPGSQEDDPYAFIYLPDEIPAGMLISPDALRTEETPQASRNATPLKVESIGTSGRRISGGEAAVRLGIVGGLLAGGLAVATTANADSSRTFSETGKTVSGKFLDYWNTHGGLPQQGFPISEQMQEKSDTDGKVYTTQYFERAVFELHPENQAPYDVLLSLLGTFEYNRKYGSNAPNQTVDTDNAVLFPETGKHIGGKFLQYWQTHGSLAQQGYPISEEFTEKSDLNGQTYVVQYFQRAVFEEHPEYAGTPNEVLLSQLGTFQLERKNALHNQTEFDPFNSKERHIEQGDNWFYVSALNEPVQLVTKDKSKVNEGYSYLPAGRKAGGFLASDQADAYKIADYYHVDKSQFRPWLIPDANNNAIKVGMIWNEIDPNTGGSTYAHHPVPLIGWFDSDQYKKIDPLALRKEILDQINVMAMTSKQEGNNFYFNTPAWGLIKDNTDLIFK